MVQDSAVLKTVYQNMSFVIDDFEWRYILIYHRMYLPWNAEEVITLFTERKVNVII